MCVRYSGPDTIKEARSVGFDVSDYSGGASASLFTIALQEDLWDAAHKSMHGLKRRINTEFIGK